MVVALEHQQIWHKLAALVEVAVVAEMLALAAQMVEQELLVKDLQVAAAMLAWAVQTLNIKAVGVVVLVV
jgi:hypothetical protein